jgi:hypothetical protein
MATGGTIGHLNVGVRCLDKTGGQIRTGKRKRDIC